MNTCTVAYVTQMVSSTAVSAGDRHQESVRSVFWLICARVLAGASVSCVIGRRLRPGVSLGSAGGPGALPARVGLASRGNPSPLDTTLRQPAGPCRRVRLATHAVTAG